MALISDKGSGTQDSTDASAKSEVATSNLVLCPPVILSFGYMISVLRGTERGINPTIEMQSRKISTKKKKNKLYA